MKSDGRWNMCGADIERIIIFTASVERSGVIRVNLIKNRDDNK